MTRLLLPTEFFDSDRIVVQGDEFHYLVHVRRHRTGDVVELRGAGGRRFLGNVERIEKERAVLLLGAEMDRAPTSWPLNLIIAVPKRNLLDDIVRKSSEMGVERLIPVRAERSVTLPGEARVERWRKIAVESLRQCGREKALAVDNVRPLLEVLGEFGGYGERFLMHPGEGQKSLPAALKAGDVAPPISLAIGPEGGFTEAEVAQACKLGFKQVGLGSAILRLETAAIVSSALCVAHLGGFDSFSNIV